MKNLEITNIDHKLEISKIEKKIEQSISAIENTNNELEDVENDKKELVEPFIFGKRKFKEHKASIENKINKLKHAKSNLEHSLQSLMDEKQYYINDLKYDRIVNCPKCKGNGELINKYFTNLRHTALEDIGNPLNDYADNWSMAGKNETYDGVGWFHTYKKETCLFCKGLGIAYAYFESAEEDCKDCDGKGFITIDTKKKVEIGVKHNTAQKSCEQCKESGRVNYEYCSLRTIIFYDSDLPAIGTDYGDPDRDDRKETKTFLERTKMEFSKIKITPKNKKVLSSHKNRFNQERL